MIYILIDVINYQFTPVDFKNQDIIRMCFFLMCLIFISHISRHFLIWFSLTTQAVQLHKHEHSITCIKNKNTLHYITVEHFTSWHLLKCRNQTIQKYRKVLAHLCVNIGTIMYLHKDVIDTLVYNTDHWWRN